MKSSQVFFGLCLISLLFTICKSPLMAQSKPGIKSLPYPELLVTPSASKRLYLEAKGEKSKAWTTHIPIQISALSTLMTGISTIMDDPTRPDDKEMEQSIFYAGLTGIGMGASWLGITTVLAASYRPYSSGIKELSVFSNKTKKGRLNKERRAVEVIARPASLGIKLRYLSLFSNLGTNIFMMATTPNQTSKVFAGVGGLLAFAPILFTYHWETVNCLQSSYKKRIYGPIVFSKLFMDRTRSHLIPGMGLRFQF